MLIALHPIAARIQPAGDIDRHRARMCRQIGLYELIQHDGAGNDAAGHGTVLIRQGEIVVEPADDFDGFLVANCPAVLGFLRAGVDGLQHGFRNPGKGDFAAGFTHSSCISCPYQSALRQINHAMLFKLPTSTCAYMPCKRFRRLSTVS